MILTTRSIRISLNQFNVELKDLSVQTFDARAMSDMLRDLNWKMLEDRRTISRLALLFKPVHNIVAINIDEHYAIQGKINITTRKMSSISFTHSTA